MKICALIIALCIVSAVVNRSPRDKSTQPIIPTRTLSFTNEYPPLPGKTNPMFIVKSVAQPLTIPQPTTNGNVTCYPAGWVFKNGAVTTTNRCVTNNPAPPLNGLMPISWDMTNYPPQGPAMWTNVLLVSTNGGQTWSGAIYIPVTNAHMQANIRINPSGSVVFKFGTNIYGK